MLEVLTFFLSNSFAPTTLTTTVVGSAIGLSKTSPSLPHNVRCDDASACIENIPSVLVLLFLVSTRRTTEHHVVPRYSVAPPIQADVSHRVIPVHVRQGQGFGDFG